MVENSGAPQNHPSSSHFPIQSRPTPDHPPYAVMVQAALRALGEEEGSTEASISSYIQSSYSSLPWGHSRLLPYYLQKLLKAQEISSPSPNRYSLVFQDKDSPPRRSPPSRPKFREVAAPPPVPESSPPEIRKRGRPRRSYSNVDTVPTPHPIEAASRAEPAARPRLVIRLKRIDAGSNVNSAGSSAGGGWRLLRGDQSSGAQL